jgi:hypothetical protein
MGYREANHREWRKLLLAFAAYASVGLGCAVAAWLTQGFVRILLVLAAVLFGAITLWMVPWVLGLRALVAVADGRDPDQGAPDRTKAPPPD